MSLKDLLKSGEYTGKKDDTLTGKIGDKIQDTKFGQIMGKIQDLTSKLGEVKEGFSLGDPAAAFGSLDDLFSSLTGADLQSLAGDMSIENLKSKFGLGNINAFTNIQELISDLTTTNLIDSFGNFLAKSFNIDLGVDSITSSFIEDIVGLIVKEAKFDFGLQGMIDLVKSKFSKWIASYMFIPEKIYLETIKPMLLLGADTKYNKNWLRYQICLKRDFELVLDFIDENENYDYDHKVLLKDGKIASLFSGVNVIYYMAQRSNKKILEYNIIIDEYEDKLKYFKKEKEEYKRVLSLAKKVTADKEDKKVYDYHIQEEQNRINKKEKEYKDKKIALYNSSISNKNKTKKAILQTIHDLIVNARSNLNVNKLDKLFKEFDIKPSVFGEYDIRYGKKFFITNKDINILAPIVKKKEQEYQFEFSLKTPHDTIAPLNKNIKRLYLYLVNKTIHGDEALIHRPLYERLSLPMQTLQNQLGDSAGTLGVTTNKIPFAEDLIYKYTNSIKNLLYDPMLIEDFIFDDNANIPEPHDPLSENDRKFKENKEILDEKIIIFKELISEKSGLLYNIKILIQNSENYIRNGIDIGKTNLYNKNPIFNKQLKEDIGSFSKLSIDLNSIKSNLLEKNVSEKTKPQYFIKIINYLKNINNLLDPFDNINNKCIDYIKSIIISKNSNEIIDEENINKTRENYPFVNKMKRFSIQKNRLFDIINTNIVSINKEVANAIRSIKENENKSLLYDKYSKKPKHLALFLDKFGNDINLDHILCEQLILTELENGSKNYPDSDMEKMLPSITKFINNELNNSELRRLNVIKLTNIKRQ